MFWILVAFLHGNPVELSSHTSQVSCQAALEWQERTKRWEQLVCVWK